MFFAVCVVAIGSGFQHGYNLVVLNHPADNIKAWINDSVYTKTEEYLSESDMKRIWSNLLSVYCFGGIIGGLLSGLLFKKIGSRKSLIFNCQILLIGIVIQSSAKYEDFRNHELLIVGRFIIGINAGINSGICALFCCDISPMILRGTMGSMYYLWTSVSILVSLCLGRQKCFGSPKNWIFLITFPPLIISTIQLVLLLLFIPECPRLLLEKGKINSAKRALIWLRNKNVDIDRELKIMHDEIKLLKTLPNLKTRDFIKVPIYKKPLIIVIVLMLAQQLSGIYFVVFFCNDLSRKYLGFSIHSTELINIGFAGLNVIVTVISVYCVEKFGRKNLLFVSFCCLFVITSLLTLFLILKSYGIWLVGISLSFTYLFIISFSLGAGSIPWFIAAELFESNSKPFAQSFGVSLNWTANFIIILLMDKIEEKIGGFVFIICLISLGLTCAFIFYFVPETKNTTVLESLKHILEGKAKWQLKLPRIRRLKANDNN